MSFLIRSYTPNDAKEWDNLVTSLQGDFTLYRNYMEYHAHRFRDFSLLVYDQSEKLKGIFAANYENKTLFSHQGLSFGGLWCANSESFGAMLERIFIYVAQQGFEEVYYKIPHAYRHSLGNWQETFFPTFAHATIEKEEINSILPLQMPHVYSSRKKRNIKKANSQFLYWEESEDWAFFWELLSENIGKKYKATPIHSLKEIKYLRGKFPHHIRLFVVKKEGSIIGGTVLYMDKHWVHAQYIASTSWGRSYGALDFLFDGLYTYFKAKHKTHFSMGTSHIPPTTLLNTGVWTWKKEFGCENMKQRVYKISLRSFYSYYFF